VHSALQQTEAVRPVTQVSRLLPKQAKLAQTMGANMQNFQGFSGVFDRFSHHTLFGKNYTEVCWT
jgi:hypothetical protein